MSIYNFFIDKIDKNSNEITIRPHYPIICSDKERLILKLVENIYNKIFAKNFVDKK